MDFLSTEFEHKKVSGGQNDTHLHAISFFRIGKWCSFSLQEVDEGLEAHVNPLQVEPCGLCKKTH